MPGSVLQDPAIRQKAEALLARMSLEQKIGQMTLTERLSVTPADVRDFHLGGVLSGSGSCPGSNRPEDWVAMNDAFWAASMTRDEKRLAIPLLYGVDAIHGHNNVRGATIFPHNIGLGAAYDHDLLKRVASVTAREILATGVDWTFAPNLSVARDIHWGRTYESYSEDTGIVTSYAGEFIQALQADLGTDGVVACIKHWVGDGGTTNGIDQGDVALSIDELETVHMRPYRQAIDAGALTIMASFSSWNGDKCHGHKFLLTDILKTQWGFGGFVISDWDGIDYLSEDYHDAVALAVNAGIDMFMVSENWKDFIAHLKRHVQRGSVSKKRIDDAVSRILKVKLAYGLFDKPRPLERAWSNHASFGSSEHRSVAREAVRKSLVLLKNEKSLLPLAKNARVLVAGKNANNLGHQCGGFSIVWQGTCGNEMVEGGTSVWEGIRQVAANASLSQEDYGADADPAQHDAAIVVIGEHPYAEGLGDVREGNHLIVEAGSQIKGSINVLRPYGKTLELASLHPEDLRTIRTITENGIPAVVVMISGRPLVVDRELEASSAFVAAWLPGSEGHGIADVLFGDFDFHGKLSFSWPGNGVNAPAGHRKSHAPLFPRGYGMTYLN
ncbi:MAG: endoglucanase [Xanthomonadales bacterium]|nr:glycoside hydrolase family 3 C-terminal domain-containing protein [Gammaproteobacteria bacterium]NNK05001.1 endoglucanase [Xanthomonadales bacterium]